MSASPQQQNGADLYRRLLRYALPYKWGFLAAIFAMILTASLDPVKAAMLKPLMDGGFINKDPNTIKWLPLAIVGIFLVGGFTRFCSQLAMAWIGRRIVFDIRSEMFVKMMHLPAGYYDRNASGALISKVIYDVEQIANAATKALFVMVKDSVSIISLLVFMFWKNWMLTSMFVVIVPLLGIFVRYISKRFRKTSRGIQRSMGDISSIVQEAVEGQRTVKAYGAQSIEIANFDVTNNKNRRQNTRRAALAAANVPVLESLAALGIAVVIYYALQRAATGALTVGDAISYFGAMMLLLGPAKRLTKINEVIQMSLAASQSVFELLDQENEQDTGTLTLATVSGEVEYRDVSFQYNEDRRALKQVSFKVPAGTTTALVGASGSGKSTIANLLPRFYSPTQGEVCIDGHNTGDLVLANLRSHISLVSQDTVLFNDSVRNNIAYGCAGEIDNDRLMEAAGAAHVLEFINALPDGLDTIVGERGARFSGGQRQRIAIARALYKNAPILILDEATSALDSESERYVQEAMRTLMRERTTLVIAHRLSTIEHAQQILVLSNGQIVERGSHARLLEKNGAYAALYHTQFNSVPDRAGVK